MASFLYFLSVSTLLSYRVKESDTDSGWETGCTPQGTRTVTSTDTIWRTTGSATSDENTRSDVPGQDLRDAPDTREQPLGQPERDRRSEPIVRPLSNDSS